MHNEQAGDCINKCKKDYVEGRFEVKTTTTDRNNGKQLDDLDFADDLVLLSHNAPRCRTRPPTCKQHQQAQDQRKKNSTATTPITEGGEHIREVDSLFTWDVRSLYSDEALFDIYQDYV